MFGIIRRGTNSARLPITHCALVGALVVGCGEQQPAPNGDEAPDRRLVDRSPEAPVPGAAAEPPSLYRRLGGEVVIGLVVQNVIQRMAADEELSDPARRSFAGDRREVAPVMRLLTERLSAAAGSPEHPSDGPALREALAELDVEGDDYDRFLSHLNAALEALDVPEADRRALLERAAE